MNASSTAPHTSAALTSALRWLGLGIAVAAGLIALAFVAAAAFTVGVVVAAAALLLRFMPSKTESDILEGRRTATGWEVETRAGS